MLKRKIFIGALSLIGASLFTVNAKAYQSLETDCYTKPFDMSYANFSQYTRQVPIEHRNFVNNLAKDGTLKNLNPDGDDYHGYVQCNYSEYVKKDSNFAWGSEKEWLPNKVAAYYQVGIANIPYKEERLGLLYQGDTITKSFSNEITKTYEESVTNTISSKLKTEAECKGNIKFTNIGIKTSQEIDNEVSKSVSYSHSQTELSSTSISRTIDSNGYYIMQYRALYAVFIVQVYDVTYHQHEIGREKAGLWNYNVYYQNVPTYYLKEQTTIYEFINDVGFSLCKYKALNDGSLIYDDVKLNDTYYYL